MVSRTDTDISFASRGIFERPTRSMNSKAAAGRLQVAVLPVWVLPPPPSAACWKSCCDYVPTEPRFVGTYTLSSLHCDPGRILCSGLRHIGTQKCAGRIELARLKLSVIPLHVLLRPDKSKQTRAFLKSLFFARTKPLQLNWKQCSVLHRAQFAASQATYTSSVPRPVHYWES